MNNNTCTQSKAVSYMYTRVISKSCLERDLNPRSPAYRAGTLTTEPPRQLSRLGTNPSVMQLGLLTGTQSVYMYM